MTPLLTSPATYPEGTTRTRVESFEAEDMNELANKINAWAENWHNQVFRSVRIVHTSLASATHGCKFALVTYEYRRD
jgi:hypothetical protein